MNKFTLITTISLLVGSLNTVHCDYYSFNNLKKLDPRGYKKKCKPLRPPKSSREKAENTAERRSQEISPTALQAIEQTQAPTCCICSTPRTEKLITLSCGETHTFHPACLQSWTSTNPGVTNYCPVCQNPLANNTLDAVYLPLVFREVPSELNSLMTFMTHAIMGNTKEPSHRIELPFGGICYTTSLLSILSDQITNDYPKNLKNIEYLLSIKPKFNINDERYPLLVEAVSYSSQEKSYPIVQCLLKAGADQTITDRCTGRPALHWAVKRNMPQIVELLHANNPSIVNQPDGLGCRPLHSAVSNGNLEMVNLILSYNPEEVATARREFLFGEPKTETARESAVRLGRLDIVNAIDCYLAQQAELQQMRLLDKPQN